MATISQKVINDYVKKLIVNDYHQQLKSLQDKSQTLSWLYPGSLEPLYPYKNAKFINPLDPDFPVYTSNNYHRIYQAESIEFDEEDDTLNLHTYEDWEKEGYISADKKNCIIQEIVISAQTHIDNGRRVMFLLNKPFDYLLQIQLVAKTLEQLETIIHSITDIDLEINFQLFNRTWGSLIRLEWETLKLKNWHIQKNNKDQYIFPIFKSFCQPSRPYALFMGSSSEIRINMIFLSEGELVTQTKNLSTVEFLNGSCLEAKYLLTERETVNDPKLPRYIKQLFGQWQFTGEEWVGDGSLTAKVRLNFNHPVACLVIFVNLKQEDYHENITDSKIREFVELIESISLIMEDQTVLDVYDFLLSHEIPISLGLPSLEKDITSSSAYYLISFNGQNPFNGIDINHLNPLINFSTLDIAALKIDFKERLSTEIRVSVMALSTNVLHYDTQYKLVSYLYPN